ncbi:uncharacterized protein LOC143037610 isoform X2 [Oratosquilla oratoria]|uniref:uncharacterized protein LOC143037610 isoform X2 n=1 Tax=Oratosquilla oratoria TaxID=337810 RepID=UPI003F76B2D5
MQEEDDLEEELQCLNIKDDDGAEESDVTPTNTPWSSSPLIQPFCHTHYHLPLTSRYSRFDDGDSGTVSSLSWDGDDFEGEATRQVNALFDQLDSLLYTHPSSFSSHPALSSTHNEVESLSDSLKFSKIDEDVARGNETVSAEHSPEVLLSSDEDKVKLDFFPKHLHNSALKQPTVVKPSSDLQEECATWVQLFPHFRVRGKQVDPLLFDRLFESENVNNAGNGKEEVIVSDGTYEDLLPLVSLTSDSSAKKNSHTPAKRSSSSRVCSGSNDPEVLREQALILMFDKIWPHVTKVILPLLNQYAKYVITQSVHYSSLSREPSTRGQRIPCSPLGTRGNGSLVPEQGPVQRTANSGVSDATPLKSASQFSGPGRPLSSGSGYNYPNRGIKRPLSSRLQLHNSPSRSNPFKHRVQEEELQDLLLVTAKPLQSSQDRIRSRTPSGYKRDSSARSYISSVSLPAVITPRTSLQRPVSSRSGHHLLAPMRTDNNTTDSGRVLSSVSSRILQEQFHSLSKQTAIQEINDPNVFEEVLSDSPSNSWSRHVTFLPPIADSAYSNKMLSKTNSGQRRSIASDRLDANGMEGKSLSVRGTIFSAQQQQTSHSKLSWAKLRPVEPFISWVVDQVDAKEEFVRQSSDNRINSKDSKGFSIAKNKHFQRYSHH